MSCAPSQDGYTLVELLIVVAILCVLAGLGYPTYARVKDRAYMVAMHNSMAAAVRAEEQYKHANGVYTDDACTAGRCVTLGAHIDRDVTLGITAVNPAANGFAISAAHSRTIRTCSIAYGLDAAGALQANRADCP